MKSINKDVSLKLHVQIKFLESKFEEMNIAEKEEFISNLQLKLKGKPASNYSEFLDRCIKKLESQKRAEKENAKRIKREKEKATLTICCAGCENPTLITLTSCEHCGAPIIKTKEYLKLEKMMEYGMGGFIWIPMGVFFFLLFIDISFRHSASITMSLLFLFGLKMASWYKKKKLLLAECREFEAIRANNDFRQDLIDGAGISESDADLHLEIMDKYDIESQMNDSWKSMKFSSLIAIKKWIETEIENGNEFIEKVIRRQGGRTYYSFNKFVISGIDDQRLMHLFTYDRERGHVFLSPLYKDIYKDEFKKEQERKYKKELQKSERSKLTPSKRIAILERDGYTCVKCGASPDDGVTKLEVDHIIPISRGGSGDDDDNLQTLCFNCNRGKATKVM